MPDHATRVAEVSVCTPWYPTAYNRVGGSFVADWSALSRQLTTRLRIVHAEEWPGGTAENVARWAADTDEVFAHLAGSKALDVTGTWGPISRIPTVITGGWDVCRRAEAAVDASRRFGPDLSASEVVHGHVGYLGGLMAARLASPGARVVVTEHSTGLQDVLASDRGLELYDEVLDRSHRLTCVSSVVRQQIVAALPRHADKVVVVPNPVNFDPPHRRPERPQSLDRWVFGGGLIRRKGVVRLVEAFLAFAADRPAGTLDLFGRGELEDRLREAVEDAGLSGRVTFHGNVGHADFLAALPEYDVLIAPSEFETFHLVVPEAVAAGLPVVVTRSGGPEEALADVEDQVARFIDVNDDPAELHSAILELEGRLGDLDLDGARATLRSRYGGEAILRRLAELYGLDAEVEPGFPPAGPPLPAGPPIHHVTFLSALGWRGYAIESEAEAASEAHVPMSVVTSDAGVQKLLAQATPISPTDFLSSLDHAPATSASGVSRVVARLQRAVRRRLATEAPPAAPPSSDTATHLLTHVSGASWAVALVRAKPDAQLALELDRPRLGLPPVDTP